MRNWIFIFLMLLCIGSANAQKAPGYLGKKISLGAGVELVPGLFGLFDTGIKLGPYFAASYVIGRHSEVGLTYETFMSETEIRVENIGQTQGYWYNGHVGLKITSIGINYNLYKNRGLAPLGPYWQFGIAKLFVAPKKFHEQEDDIVGGPLDNYDYLVFSVGVYRKDILYGPIFVNYGVHVNYTTGFKYGGTLNPVYNPHSDQDHPNKILDRLKRGNLFVFRLGIGVLI